MKIIKKIKTTNTEYIKGPFFTYKRVCEVAVLSMPFFKFKKVGSHCAAFIFGYPVFTVIGFQSKLFGVPFYLGDIRWLPFHKNS